MSHPLIAVTRPIHQAGLELLQSRYEVKVHENTVMSEDELAAFASGSSALVSLLTDPITDKVLAAAGPELKIVAQYAVGFNNIDLESAQKRHIVVSHTPGTLSATAVAEHAMALLLSLSRHIVYADRYVREGKYTQWDPNLFLGASLSGKTLGIIGVGHIGSDFARICHNGFKMRILYHDLNRHLNIERDLGALQSSLEKLLIKSDIVSLHVPLTPATHHLLGREQFQLMQPGAFLINTSRGPVIDETALVEALQSNKIAGAALDVFEDETSLKPGLADLKNVLLTPHIGSATENTRKAMSECVARNVIAAIEGSIIPNPVRL